MKRVINKCSVDPYHIGSFMMSFHHSTPAPEKIDILPIQSAPIYDAHQITDQNGKAMIVLDDKTYTLRITRAGKLILTK